MASKSLPNPKSRRTRKPTSERRAIPRSTALNAHEAEVIDAAAQKQGVSVSAFLRQVALKAAKEAGIK